MTNKALLTLTEQLRQHGYTVTCAESCTGGLLAGALTEYAGSSAWFDMGFVTYSNQAKQQLLGVTEQTLIDHGAVSAATVAQMADGALSAAQADFALSVSGIAGPGGGSAAKPVGTVWFGLAQRQGLTLTLIQHFEGERDHVRQQAVTFALSWLADTLTTIHSN
ncbi:MAG: nicotinamide-nucleotide amidase [Neisseriaceae bacterium]|nr:nicotinamide-nucleotide amidase [Neisseriaceae bacterium]